MPDFTYTAMDRTGTRTRGTVSASNRAAALDQVTQRGLFPVDVSEQRRRGHAPIAGAPKTTDAAPHTDNRGNGNGHGEDHGHGHDSGGGRVSAAAVEAFIRELSNLLAGGVSLARALTILKREASSANAAAQWAAIHDDVAGGSSLAEALARRGRSFPPVYVAMVRAGETGGFLDLVLAQIADFRARERDLLGKVKAAMIYPCVLAVLAVGVIVFCLTYFIPRFSAIFADFGAGLPLLTRIVVALSKSMASYGLLAAFVLLLGALVVQRALSTDAGRRRYERILLRTPAIGRIVARFALVRFTRMLGTLLGAGVPLINALRVAREAIGNQTLTDAVTRATEDVQRGTSLARSLAETPDLFPPAVIEMVAVAEETGRLDKELVRIAATYESDLDRQLRMVVALAEPALLFIMAGIIGTLFIAMLLPVFTLQDLIK